jgi:hypothetical protein
LVSGETDSSKNIFADFSNHPELRKWDESSGTGIAEVKF